MTSAIGMSTKWLWNHPCLNIVIDQAFPEPPIILNTKCTVEGMKWRQLSTGGSLKNAFRTSLYLALSHKWSYVGAFRFYRPLPTCILLLCQHVGTLVSGFFPNPLTIKQKNQRVTKVTDEKDQNTCVVSLKSTFLQIARICNMRLLW